MSNTQKTPVKPPQQKKEGNENQKETFIKTISENMTNNVIQIQFNDVSEDGVEDSFPKNKPNSKHIKKSEEVLEKLQESLRNYFAIAFQSSSYWWWDAYDSFVSSLI